MSKKNFPLSLACRVRFVYPILTCLCKTVSDYEEQIKDLSDENARLLNQRELHTYT